MTIPFLSEIDGFGPALCRRVKARWPWLLDDSELRSDPYRLTEIQGIGFQRADAVARALGIAPDAPQRLNAGAQHVLGIAEQEGHTGLNVSEFADRLAEVLRVSLPRDADFEGVELDGDFLQRQGTARAEQTVAVIVKSMMREEEPLAPIATEGLADDQHQAVEAIRYFPVFVLLGGPGVGKTYAIRTLVEGCKGSVALCAPTGKAAKRIEELSGRPAQTIHRLLGVDRDGHSDTKAHSRGFRFRHNRHCRLPHDLVIVDEASMIDVRLMADLCEALSDTARLVMVGDPFQLAAVGPGAVLRDLVLGGVPYFELTELKRQEPGLLIARNCKLIQYERRVVVDNAKAADFFHVPVTEAAATQRAIVEIVADRLPKKYGLNPCRDIVTLTALREKGALSVKALNAALRARLNPEATVPWPTRGDRVIQCANNYDLDVMNGDLGTVVEAGNGRVRVLFDTPAREVTAESADLDLQLAYALTVHRFQGSEQKWVVVGLHEESGTMVPTAQHLYTSISRAREGCVVVGSRSALDAAAARHREVNRQTRLAKLLQTPA